MWLFLCPKMPQHCGNRKGWFGLYSPKSSLEQTLAELEHTGFYGLSEHPFQCCTTSVRKETFSQRPALTS